MLLKKIVITSYITKDAPFFQELTHKNSTIKLLSVEQSRDGRPPEKFIKQRMSENEARQKTLW